MNKNISLNTRAAVICVVGTLAVGLGMGWFAGQKHGYTEGVIKASAAGFQMGGAAVMSGSIASEVEKLPAHSRIIGEAMCSGFKSTLPCASASEADQLIQSNDPVDQMIGSSCKSILSTLRGCGDGYVPPIAQ